MMELVKATLEDVELLLEFAERTFRVAYEAMNEPEDFDKYCQEAFTAEQFSKEIQHPQSTFWLGWLEGDLVAYLKLNVGTYTESLNTGKYFQIERIYVDPKWQGNGLGEILLDFCYQQAQLAQSDWIWLSVWQRNPRAVHFYERCGYEVCGTEVFQLGDDPQLDWVMRKEVFSL